MVSTCAPLGTRWGVRAGNPREVGIFYIGTDMLFLSPQRAHVPLHCHLEGNIFWSACELKLGGEGARTSRHGQNRKGPGGARTPTGGSLPIPSALGIPEAPVQSVGPGAWFPLGLPSQWPAGKAALGFTVTGLSSFTQRVPSAQALGLLPGRAGFLPFPGHVAPSWKAQACVVG